MAAGILPERGSQYGPCLDKCRHRDCMVTRYHASRPCKYYGDPIGYERGFYDLGDKLAHSSCHIDALDKETKL